MAARRVEILLFDGLQSLDVTGPLEVFATADRIARRTRPGERGYAVATVAAGGEPVRSTSGLGLLPGGPLPAPGAAAPDLLVIPGGEGVRAAAADPATVAWVGDRAAAARRVASVCTGARLLAAAGVLDGRRATTHWAHAGDLAARHPRVEVDAEPVWIRDGDVWTSAGVTAGMDLALALVEDDLGRETALATARYLVMFLRRPGSQAQFSAALGAQIADRDALREVQLWLADHLDEDCSVPALAERAAMSPRHFARAFHAAVGVTPARYVERLRLEAARRRLEESADPVERVAAACGFGTAETMRRTFLRALDVSPMEYRRRFAPVPLP